MFLVTFSANGSGRFLAFCYCVARALPASLLFACTLAQAASLAVWPINPRLDAPASSTLVWVKNNSGDSTVTLQARIFTWRQANNDDELIVQDELVVSPPMIEVKPGGQQVFRVVNRAGAVIPSAQEKSFRMLIDEIPRPTDTPTSALKFQMRYSLPLFVGSPAAMQNKTEAEKLKVLEQGLTYNIIRKPEGASVEINNRSPIHSRLSNVAIHAGGQQLSLSNGLLGYILPSTSRRWPLTNEQLATLSSDQATIRFQQERRELRIVAEP